MNAPKRSSRIGLRVHDDTKARLAEVLKDLQERGLYASETEVAETFLRIGLDRPIDEIEASVRHNRATSP